MGEHKRLVTLLQLIRLLSQGVGYPVKRLARRYDVTDRTIYRYLNILKEIGFTLVNERNRYRIDTSETNIPLLPALTDDELATMSEAIYSLPSHSPKRASLLQKLHHLTHPDLMIDLIVDHSLGRVIHDVIEAIHQREVILLCNYQSTGTRTEQTRRVEPIGFATNLRYLQAYDQEEGSVRLYKPERIESVERTGIYFEPGDRHKVSPPDPFGMNGTPEVEVTLDCNRRAASLLIEEYPEVQLMGSIQESDNQITIRVRGFEGIGRFVLGLPGEATPVAPKPFLDYLRKRAQTAKWM
ncbi:MAG: WYL domain-containing protein [Balneolaceae bacterium]